MGSPQAAALAGSNPFFVGLQHGQYWVNQDPNWDWRSLNYENFGDYFRASVEQFNEVIGTDDPDLTAFRDAGGHVLIWHGWSNPLIFAEGSIDYDERVLDTVGGPAKAVEEFARLYMAPGVGHCGGGSGPSPVDALVRWVEHGEDPDSILAARAQGGEVVMTRPLCVYPDVARWTGRGSTDEASNFRCELKGLDRADHAAGYERGEHGRNKARRAQMP